MGEVTSIADEKRAEGSFESGPRRFHPAVSSGPALLPVRGVETRSQTTGLVSGGFVYSASISS